MLFELSMDDDDDDLSALEQKGEERREKGEVIEEIREENKIPGLKRDLSLAGKSGSDHFIFIFLQ